MDLGRAIRDVASEVQASHPSITVRVQTTGDLSGTWDCERLTQALTNLLSNAVYHGDTKRPIQISGIRSPHEVTVAVHNHGIAIPAQQLGQLFDPMKSVAPARDGGHLGLGLYIVARIAKAHDGAIEVASSSAGGTTFTLRLPVAA
jgi:signal transduction histidine kinase